MVVLLGAEAGLRGGESRPHEALLEVTTYGEGLERYKIELRSWPRRRPGPRRARPARGSRRARTVGARVVVGRVERAAAAHFETTDTLRLSNQMSVSPPSALPPRRTIRRWPIAGSFGPTG